MHTEHKVYFIELMTLMENEDYTKWNISCVEKKKEKENMKHFRARGFFSFSFFLLFNPPFRL